jgi:hypothetical protein
MLKNRKLHMTRSSKLNYMICQQNLCNKSSKIGYSIKVGLILYISSR